MLLFIFFSSIDAVEMGDRDELVVVEGPAVAGDEAGERVGELLAVVAVGDEAAPAPGDALEAADGFGRETREDLHDEVVGELGRRIPRRTGSLLLGSLRHVAKKRNLQMGSKSSSDDRETDEEGSRRRLAGAYRRSARRRRRSPFRVAVAAAAGRSGCWGFRGGGQTCSEHPVFRGNNKMFLHSFFFIKLVFLSFQNIKIKFYFPVDLSYSLL